MLCPPQNKQISESDLWELPGDEKAEKKTEGSTKAKFEDLKERWKDD